ncbi:hypothetical protein T4B_1562, partial [Trichinella pseudospiralis]
MAWNQQIVYGRTTCSKHNEMHALNFLAILDIKYTVIYLFFHFTFYVKFFWFSKTYKQLIQVLAEVQHDLW